MPLMASFFHKLLKPEIAQGLCDTRDDRVSNPVNGQLCYMEWLETSLANKVAGPGCGGQDCCLLASMWSWLIKRH